MAIGVTMTRGVAAGAFAFTSNVAEDDTVVIGAVTYTFKTTPAAAYQVDVGTDLDTSIGNLVAAINLSGTAGSEYHTDHVTAHPDFTAAADLANDELDLTARCAGSHSAGVYLAATSPGANTIAAGGVTFAAVSGGTDGAGALDAWIESLISLNQINSEVLFELKQLTDAAD